MVRILGPYLFKFAYYIFFLRDKSGNVGTSFYTTIMCTKFYRIDPTHSVPLIKVMYRNIQKGIETAVFFSVNIFLLRTFLGVLQRILAPVNYVPSQERCTYTVYIRKPYRPSFEWSSLRRFLCPDFKWHLKSGPSFFQLV